jgi:hypothetical protein
MIASVVFLLCVMLAAYAGERFIVYRQLFRWILIASLWYGAVSVVQLAIATLSSNNVLLCKGCGEAVFNFVRINGFAAEPLFWANALLPFFAVSLYEVLRHPRRLSYAALFINTLSIGLTLARGAYVSTVLCTFFITWFAHHRHKLGFGGARGRGSGSWLIRFSIRGANSLFQLSLPPNTTAMSLRITSTTKQSA